MIKNRVENGIDILQYSLDNDVSISKSCVINGFSRTYAKNIKIDILAKEKIERNDLEKVFLEKHEEVLSRNAKQMVKKESISSNNTDIDEKFDERSKCWVNRDDKGRIESYSYEILVRDEMPFKGDLSRVQMETIYSYYPYVTRNTVSQFFPFLNFIQLKRILRVFNITKDKLFPPHLVEELTETQLGELALKNKENAGFKKFTENKNQFYEQELRKTQLKMFQIEEDTKFLEKIIDKTLDKYSNKFIYNKYVPKLKSDNVIHDSLIFTFGDIHFGKKFNEVIYGRGVNSQILEERCMAIAEDIVLQANLYKSKNIILNVLGDIFESILPDGMHPEHHKRMDLIGEQQLDFGIQVFEKMIDYIQENILFEANIKLYCIGGNHDRIGENRDQDKRRTASAIFYIILKKIFQLKKYNNVEVIEPEDGIMRYSIDGLSIIGFHGDSKLFNSNPVDIINLFKVGDSKNYTVILNGHWHSVKMTEGINYKRVVCGSVCSPDEFVQNELGKGSQPSYVVIKKAKGYGVDVEIKTLY